MEQLHLGGDVNTPIPPVKNISTSTAFDHDDTSICLHEGGIPLFLQAELDKLYGHLFSSSAMFRVCGVCDEASVYTARKAGIFTAIFAYRIQGRTIEVFNEQIRCRQEDIHRFANCMFLRYPSVRAIRFKAIQAAGNGFGYPCQRTPFTNDVVLMLPGSADEYLSSIGKSTRENIRRYLKLLKRDLPSHRAGVVEGNKADDTLLRQIISLSHERMQKKRKDSGISAEEERRLFALTRECGLVTTIEAEGRLCAGTILYRVGDNFFLRVLAHDPSYDKYRMGLLCCYLSICECIARGGKRYHFLWGREPYKYRLHGDHLDLDLLTLYRTHFHAAMDGASLLKNALAANARNLKWHLIETDPQAGPLIRIARRTLHVLKEGPFSIHRATASPPQHGA